MGAPPTVPSSRPDAAGTHEPRRRSDRAQAAILAAAWELFTARGLRELTIEAIAGRAGVGKTTIYRWWPSKAAVVLDALHEHFDATIGFPDTGSAREDLRRQLRSVIALLNTASGEAYLALIAESQHDTQLARALAARYLAARRAAAAEVIERGIARGELRHDLDPGAVIDLLYGAVYYRVLVSHDPPTPDYADTLIAHAFAGLEAVVRRGRDRTP
jgi:AcrR family transcriptional regulator